MLALIALGAALGFAELGFGELETTLAAGEGVTLAADEPEETVLLPAGVDTVFVDGPETTRGFGAGVGVLFGELETTLAAGEGVTFAAFEFAATVLLPAGVEIVLVACLALLDSLLAALPPTFLSFWSLVLGIRRISCIRRQGDHIPSAQTALPFDPP
jgi:hypothetical protein